jgi:DNA-binding PucR family transcriptional regulator
MAPKAATVDSTAERAGLLAAETARTMGSTLSGLADSLQVEMTDAIPELRGDQLMHDLLRASTESNVETFLQFIQGLISLDDVHPPTAAVAYARRLAQRGTSASAMLRAYRLGQQKVVEVAFSEISRNEPDHEVAYQAIRIVHEAAFAYVDMIAEQVIAEYEAERERWLANRNTVRAAMLTSLLSGHEVDVATGESALGYRLRQNHLGLVVWDTGRESSTTTLRQLDSLVAVISDAVGGVGQPLFIPQDHSSGWAWIPLGRTPVEIDVDRVRKLVVEAGAHIRAAIGTVGPAVTGFRSSHLEAVRAHTVADVAGEQSEIVTNFAEPGVRAVSLLTGDLASARDLVSDALGGLAEDEESAARLRETLLVFLSEGGSYVSTAERIHVHKNTVKYRVDKAIEVRGRALDDDRFNLELALLACHWFGRAVLTR